MQVITWWTFVWVSLVTFTTSAHAKLLFEGYYKISAQGQPVGYYIQRYELDGTAKKFISTYYYKTNELGGNIAESLRAEATPDLKPLAYQYTSLQGTAAKTIDATFAEQKMLLKIIENGKLTTLQRDLPEGTFLATFLTYLLLQGEKGLQKGVKYSYKAVAEEDAKVYAGEVYVEGEEKQQGINSFKILNTFKNSQFLNFVTANGESLSSYSPAAAIGAELVASPAAALAGFTTQESSWKIVFGDVPVGKENALAKKAVSEAASPELPSGTTIITPAPQSSRQDLPPALANPPPKPGQ